MAPGSKQCRKPLFLTHADKLQHFLGLSGCTNVGENTKKDARERKKENELKQSKTLGMV